MNGGNHLPYRVELTRLKDGEPYATFEGGKGFHGGTDEGFDLTGIINHDEAKFIVRACNSHAALVAALDGVLATRGKPMMLEFLSDAAYDEAVVAHNQARAALAMAKGEP